MNDSDMGVRDFVVGTSTLFMSVMSVLTIRGNDKNMYHTFGSPVTVYMIKLSVCSNIGKTRRERIINTV